MFDSEKRKFLALSGLAVGGAALTGCASASYPTVGPANTGFENGGSNPKDPAENLNAIAKVFGDTSGAPVWFATQGRIYSVEPDHPSRPLFSIEGIRRVRIEKSPEGYQVHMRDWAFYLDPVTGQALDRYENPLTGKTNDARHILTGLQSFLITPSGVDFGDDRVASSWLGDKPLQLPWMDHGDHTSVSLEFMIEYSNGNVGSEWMHFSLLTSELRDPGVRSTSANLFWAGESPWIRWMDMGDRPGRTSWQSTGFKYQTPDQLAPRLLEHVERYFPGSLAAPETYERVSLTTSPEH